MRYTTEQILKAAEIGEVSMLDATHIVNLLPIVADGKETIIDRIIQESDLAKNILRLKGYGWTGLSLLKTVEEVPMVEPQPFATEQDAINWVMRYTPFAVIPKKKVKYDLVYPFSSQRAQTQVVECIGKALFELLTKTK